MRSWFHQALRRGATGERDRPRRVGAQYGQDVVREALDVRDALAQGRESRVVRSGFGRQEAVRVRRDEGKALALRRRAGR